MKKIAMIFSVVALIFAYSTTTVSAQKAPDKAKTEKVSDTKTPKTTDAKAAGCTHEAKAGCASDDKAKAGCATPCTSGEKKSGCCSSKAAATPVPAPEKK
jgi:hypothetical protein